MSNLDKTSSGWGTDYLIQIDQAKYPSAKQWEAWIKIIKNQQALIPLGILIDEEMLINRYDERFGWLLNRWIKQGKVLHVEGLLARLKKIPEINIEQSLALQKSRLIDCLIEYEQWNALMMIIDLGWNVWLYESFDYLIEQLLMHDKALKYIKRIMNDLVDHGHWAYHWPQNNQSVLMLALKMGHIPVVRWLVNQLKKAQHQGLKKACTHCQLIEQNTTSRPNLWDMWCAGEPMGSFVMGSRYPYYIKSGHAKLGKNHIQLLKYLKRQGLLRLDNDFQGFSLYARALYTTLSPSILGVLRKIMGKKTWLAEAQKIRQALLTVPIKEDQAAVNEWILLDQVSKENQQMDIKTWELYLQLAQNNRLNQLAEYIETQLTYQKLLRQLPVPANDGKPGGLNSTHGPMDLGSWQL